MSGNTNPNNAQKVTNLVAHFTSLDSDAQAAIAALLTSVSYGIVFAIDTTQQTLIPARDGFVFILTNLLLVASQDLSAATGTFNITDSFVVSQSFNWSDYIADLNVIGKVVNIPLGGIGGRRTTNGLPVFAVSSDVTILSVKMVAVGQWVAV